MKNVIFWNGIITDDRNLAAVLTSPLLFISILSQYIPKGQVSQLVILLFQTATKGKLSKKKGLV